MKHKKLFIFFLICLLLTIGGFILAYNLTHYTIYIRNPNDIVKIKYTDFDGDVYELTDKELIDQYVDSINGMAFKRIRITSVSFGSSGYIAFYNKKGEKVYAFSINSDSCISLGNYMEEYITDKTIDTDIFSEYGEFIENIHY